MFSSLSPISHLAQPAVLLAMVLGFLFGLVLHNVVQSLVAARFGDRTAKMSGFAGTEPQRHLNPFSLLWYAIFGFGVPNPVPMRLSSTPGVVTMLAGPLTMFVWAFVLFVISGLGQRFDISGVALGFQFAAYGSLAHTVFFLVPLPGLDGGRALWASGNRAGREFLQRVEAAGPIVFILIWLALSLTGLLGAIIRPFAIAMQTLLGWIGL